MERNSATCKTVIGWPLLPYAQGLARYGALFLLEKTTRFAQTFFSDRKSDPYRADLISGFLSLRYSDEG
jgi:hypothetical protein